MAETTRKRILARFEQNMKSLGLFKHTEINRMTVIDIDEVPLPAVFVYSGPEERLREKETNRTTLQYSPLIGKENWEWKIYLEVWGENLDLEEVLGSIHEVMFADYRVGGEAVEAVRSGVEMWVIDPERIITAMLIEYTVVYRHELGKM